MNLPGILDVELNLVVAELTQRAGWRLIKAVELSQQCTGQRVPARRLRGAGRRSGRPRAETKLAVDVTPGWLVLAVALVEDAAFQSVLLLHPSQVVIHVDCGICLLPGCTSQIASGKIGVREPVETHVRDGLVGSQRIKKLHVKPLRSPRDITRPALGLGETMT